MKTEKNTESKSCDTCSCKSWDKWNYPCAVCVGCSMWHKREEQINQLNKEPTGDFIESCERAGRLFSNKIETDIKYEKDIINCATKEIYMKGFNQSIENLDRIKLKLGEMRRFLNNDLHPLVSPDNYLAYSDLIDMVDELEVLLFPDKSNDVEE